MSKPTSTTELSKQKKKEQEQDENSPLLGERKNSLSSIDSAEQTKEVYNLRYSTDGKVESKYTSAFTNRDKLVADGEKAVFKEGLTRAIGAISDESKAWDSKAQEIHNNNFNQQISEEEKLAKWQESAKEIIEKLETKRVTLLDFGCGDGRSLELLTEMAKKLEPFGIALRVKSYDISEEGLKSYEQKLKNPLTNQHEDVLRNHYEEIYKNKKEIYQKSNSNSFLTDNDYEILRESFGDKEVKKLKKAPRFLEMTPEELMIYNEKIENDEDSKIKKLKVLKHNNLEIEFLKGGPQITSEEWKNEIGEVDMSLILYGSTSHIFPQSERNNFLKAIFGVTKNQLVATLPGQGDWQKELEEAKNNSNFQEGEIVYKSRDTGHDLPYATYTYNLLKETMDEVCGKDKYSITVSSVYNPREIAQNNWTELKDKVMRNIIPASCVKPSYFGVLAEAKNQNKDDGRS
jgi:hypothetical protein